MITEGIFCKLCIYTVVQNFGPKFEKCTFLLPFCTKKMDNEKRMVKCYVRVLITNASPLRGVALRVLSVCGCIYDGVLSFVLRKFGG